MRGAHKAFAEQIYVDDMCLPFVLMKRKSVSCINNRHFVPEPNSDTNVSSKSKLVFQIRQNFKTLFSFLGAMYKRGKKQENNSIKTSS